MTDSIPRITLNSANRERYEQLAARFKSRFGHEASFYGRAPGRVNLIGEHIDYCGYSVLPMAIEHDIVIAVSLNQDGLIRLINVDESFNEYETKVADFIIDKVKPKWHDYFLAGVMGIVDKFGRRDLTGMNVCVHGQVPKSAGLSSSSALVVCSAMVTLYANKLELTRTELADLCAVSERHVGTQGGGMDQAISCLAESGAAKLIDFNPLRVTNVNLPAGSLFVITNSCVEMNKAATSHFNTRVAECRLSTQILAKMKGLDWKSVKKPLELQQALKASLPDMVELVKSSLHETEYSLTEISKLLDATEEEIVATSLNQNTAHLREFQLYKRALHVFSEAQRVYEFKQACDEASSHEHLGNLMNQSHQSCSVLYDCSCPELDQLTEICRGAGAYGSRLTGAGWGGCAVSLVAEHKLDEFLASVKDNYYSRSSELKSKFALAAFATKPSAGISIILPS